MRQGGFALIAGEPGTGKSVSLRVLADRLSRSDGIRIAAITHPSSRLSDFYREIGEMFGVDLMYNNRWASFKNLRERWLAHVDDTRWVRDALVRQRALRADVLEACHGRGFLYADERLNAVFVCRNANGNPAGAEIIGTVPQAGTKRFRGMAPGSRKARGGFWLPCDRNPPASVILTESAVDAISARSLRIEGTRENGAVVASTAGIASAVPTWIEDWKPKRVICAYDADSAGDAAADRLAVNDPRVIRLRPKGAKDWNEILLRLQ